MSGERDYANSVLRTMRVGQHISLDGHFFRRAFPCGFPSIYETHEQAFLSSRIGSAWGGWRVWYDGYKDSFIVSRHEEGDKRVYVDPDRQHLFKRMPDGTL